MITDAVRRARLAQLQNRAAHLTMFGFHQSGQPWSQYLAAGLKDRLATDEGAQENAVKLGKLFRRAHDGDQDARHELHELLIETTVNYVLPASNWARFFEVRTLAPSQSPAIQNNTKQEITAAYVAQDGGVTTTKVIKPQNEATVDLCELISEEVWYRTRDLYTGDVSEASRAMFDISFDITQKLEYLLYTLLAAQLGSFDVTNANKAARVYQPHSRIASGVLPTTNALSITSVGAATTFTTSTLTEVLDYCVRFAGTDPSGDLRPTGEIIVPSQDVREFAGAITLIGAKQSDVTEQLNANGWFDLGNIWGVSWKVIPDNTIARKACFPVLNKPVGILWLKPSFDDIEEKVDKMKNLASRREKKAFGMAVPIPNKKNFIKVTYRT